MVLSRCDLVGLSGGFAGCSRHSEQLAHIISWIGSFYLLFSAPEDLATLGQVPNRPGVVNYPDGAHHLV